MVIHLNALLEAKLEDLARLSGQPAEELVREAIAGYVDELAELRATIEQRHIELAEGVVEAIPGDQAKRLFDPRIVALRASRG